MTENEPQEAGREGESTPEGEPYVPPGEPGGEDAPALPPDFTPEDPNPPIYVPPPSDADSGGI